MSKNNKSDKTVNEIYNDEITIGELIVKIKQLFSLLWGEKNRILIVVAVTLVLGLIIDYSMGKEYEAENSILTYTRAGAGGVSGNLGGLAGLAGINLNDIPGGMGGQLVSESMLPMLISTYPVGSKLAEEPLRFYQYEEMSAYDYFRNVYQDPFIISSLRTIINFPRRLLSFMNPASVQLPAEEEIITSDNEENRSEEELMSQDNPVVEDDVRMRRPFFVPKSGMNGIIEELADRIVILNEDGVMKVSARMPDAYAAADLASLATDILMQEMINFEVRKTRDQLNFLEEQYEVSRERYEQAQIALADFTDRNRGNLTAMAQIERQRLQNDYDLAFNIYSTWSRQVEETRMRLREDTPLFTEVDPAQVPSRPVRPNPVSTTIISVLIGFIWGAGYVTINRLYQAYKPEAVEDDD
ncbi:MAG: hypothetical protein WDZ80_03050 [Candidatus Paceibacterota bacterium]